MKKYSEKVTKKDQDIGKIMEINVISTRVPELLTRVEGLISHNSVRQPDKGKFYIVTPNPELVLMAQDNSQLKVALNDAAISIPDGVGLKIADHSLKIIKGRELFLDLVKLASKRNWKIFLLGGHKDEALIAKLKLENLLKNENCKLEIGYDSGPRLDNSGEPVTDADVELEEKVIKKINKFTPDLLFVAFGNPKQEIWIHKNIKKLNIRGAMAVGGTFRYIAGLSKLPPRWMAGTGLEWLWRLVTEPKRVGRIFKAVVVFPIRLLIYQLTHLGQG